MFLSKAVASVVAILAMGASVPLSYLMSQVTVTGLSAPNAAVGTTRIILAPALDDTARERPDHARHVDDLTRALLEAADALPEDADRLELVVQTPDQPLTRGNYAREVVIVIADAMLPCPERGCEHLGLDVPNSAVVDVIGYQVDGGTAEALACAVRNGGVYLNAQDSEMLRTALLSVISAEAQALGYSLAKPVETTMALDSSAFCPPA